MDSRSGIGAGLWGRMRAAGAVGAAATAILLVAGCASYHAPVGAEAPESGVTVPPPPLMVAEPGSTASVPQTATEASIPLTALPASAPEASPALSALPATAASSVTGPDVGSTTNVPSASNASNVSRASEVAGLSAERQSKRILMAAYESKLRHDRAVVNAYQRERRRQPAVERSNDRSYFLHRMLQDGLMRLSEPELLAWAQLQRSLADRGASRICSGAPSPHNAPTFNQAMSINALSVDEVAQYLDLSYQAIHDAAVGKPFRPPSKWRVQAAQINLAAQVVALIAQHPEDAKRLAIFEAEGEKKSPANRCWMAALGMRAALRLHDPDRDIILRTLVQRDVE